MEVARRRAPEAKPTRSDKRGSSVASDDIRSDEAWRLIEASLAHGLGRLVEGQRRFAEEFGLPYSRVFSDEFEAFKGRHPRAVIREWLNDREGDQGAHQLENLFTDLVDHQLALLEGLQEALVQPSSQQPTPPSGFLARLRHRVRSWWSRVTGDADKANSGDNSADYAAIPALVVGYARAREYSRRDGSR